MSDSFVARLGGIVGILTSRVAGVSLLTMLACGGNTSPRDPSITEQPQETLASGDIRRSLYHQGIERTYILHVPAGYDPAHPTPVVMAFHSIGLYAEDMMRISGLNTQADISGFFVVYPNGSGEQQSWNDGHCCGTAAREEVDDVGFVRALILDLSSLVNIDSARIYATGFSNGAIMVYRLACESSDLIAAIGPVSATPALPDLPVCEPGRLVPVVHFHGTNDRLNPYEGGTSAGGVQFTFVEETMQFWLERNHCPGQPQRTESGSVIHDRYVPCAEGAIVELYTVIDGEHAWPGGEAVSSLVGEPNMEISATEIMWEFFSGHSLPQE